RLLLEREIARALRSSGEPVPACQDPTCEPRELLLSALRRVRGPDFETLLDLVHRHHVVLSASELADCSQRFVADWAEHPGRPVNAGTLAERSLLTGLLREELRARTRARPSLSWQLGEQWWELLLPSACRLHDPLDAAVIAAAIARGTPEQRAAVVADQLDAADCAGDPRGAWARAVTVLWRAAPATDDELVELARRAPVGTVLPLYLLAGLRDRVLAPTSHPAALDLCGLLYDAGLLPAEPSLLSRVRLDRELRDLCERLPGTGPETVLGELQRLGEPVQSVVLAREPAVRTALLRSDPAVATELLRYLPGELRGYFLSWLAVEVEAASNARPVVLAFYLARLADEELAHQARVRLDHFLRAWPERAPVHLVSEASRAILLYGAVARSQWAELVPDPPAVESRRGLFRRSSGRW
ncbi:MAG: hypothetical protein QG608_1416, partial [Actinomycetota bacterium]|nr:hypothetical protein [Actinomycetota bacterium]